MRKNIGDKVILSLSQEEIEEELANMEAIRNVLLMKLESPQDKKELNNTFDVAITAMQMIWLNMQEETDEL